MTCDRCPLALQCLGGRLRVSYCQTCQRVIMTLPPRTELPSVFAFPGTMSHRVIDYHVATCDQLDLMPLVVHRRDDCPVCYPEGAHYEYYRRLHEDP